MERLAGIVLSAGVGILVAGLIVLFMYSFSIGIIVVATGGAMVIGGLVALRTGGRD